MKKREAVTKEPESSLVADIKAMFAEYAKCDEERRAEADKREAERRAEADKRDAERRAEEAEREAKRRAEEAKREAKRRAEEAEREAKRRAEEAEREAKRRAEAAKDYAELRKMMKELSRRQGGTDENIGLHAEQFFQDSLARTLRFGGEKYNSLQRNTQRSDKTSGVELDILLINGKSVAIIEAKNRIHPKDIKILTEEKIVKFRNLFPEYQKHKVYLGLAGFSFSQKAREDALARGIGILKQVGDSVEVDAGHLKAY